MLHQAILTLYASYCVVYSFSSIIQITYLLNAMALVVHQRTHGFVFWKRRTSAGTPRGVTSQEVAARRCIGSRGRHLPKNRMHRERFSELGFAFLQETERILRTVLFLTLVLLKGQIPHVYDDETHSNSTYSLITF